MESPAIKMIAELENENRILEINMSVLGDADGQIFGMIAENEHLMDILTEIYSN